jgi:flagellar basal body-associated protein FliL
MANTESQPDSEKKVSIKAPLLLITLFVLAASVGVAHHFFYASLDGQTAENQAVRRLYPTPV